MTDAEALSHSFKELVSRLLETDANARPPADEALRHSFFRLQAQHQSIKTQRWSGALVMYSEDTGELVLAQEVDPFDKGTSTNINEGFGLVKDELHSKDSNAEASDVTSSRLIDF